MKFIDLTRQKFGRLTVISRAENTKLGQAQWLCRCSCGNEKIIRSSDLKLGKIRSCGCLYIKHGHTRGGKRSKTHSAWDSMIQRCTNPNNPQYKYYGGRGITVCNRWQELDGQGFKNFLEDMGEIPKGKELDRIDNNKLINSYSPENCKLSTRKEQARNMRSNKNYNFNDRIRCRRDLAEEYGIAQTTLRNRLDNMGLSIEDALTIPVQKINRRTLLIHNYEHQLRGALEHLRLNKINSSKHLSYNKEQLHNHLDNIIKNQNNSCPMCSMSYEINPFDIDHIIPTHTANTKEELLKLFNLNNLSLLCYKCNRCVKRDRLDIKYNYGFNNCVSIQ
jgi:hypothetical protein